LIYIQSFTSCAEAFHHGAEIFQRHWPAAYDGEESFSCIFTAKEKDCGSKERIEHEMGISSQFIHAGISSQFMHAKH